MEDRIEGKNPVLEAMRTGRALIKIYLAEGAAKGAGREIIDEARKRGIPVERVPRSATHRMAETKANQGVIAVAAAREYVELDELLDSALASGEPALIAVLDGVQDPHNLGSIIRSAAASGAHGVIIPERRAAGLTAVAVKASAGAVEHVPVSRVVNLVRAIETLKKRGIWVSGADASGETALWKADFRGHTALVIGAEGAGLSRLVREKCDFLVNIPMKGGVGSLNAGVAGALMLFEAMRQRAGAGDAGQ